MSTKRAYHSEIRVSQARETRQRILQSAKQLFEAKGFDRTTIEEIALSSGVSPPLIYALFKSKLGILREIMDRVFPPERFEALVKSCKKGAPKRHLMLSAKIARKIYDAEKEQMYLFKGASVLSVEFKLLEEEREKRRHKRQEDTIKALHRTNSLKKGLKESLALDLLWALTGRDLYRMLVIEQNWPSNRYEKWLGEHLVHTLLDSVVTRSPPI
ncbi:MAG TPA: TetR/AcrR family transcriptional regulator [Rhabdochlamydiaceae bacterium]|jgi:AcrR family transcriptional regulator